MYLGTGGTVMARLELASHGIEESTDHGSTPDALFQLGLMYCVGRDVELDLIEAHKWFNIAAMRGNDSAKQYRFEISREMSKNEVSRAQRLAREWLARH
jgi:TPR repeat protein